MTEVRVCPQKPHKRLALNSRVALVGVRVNGFGGVIAFEASATRVSLPVSLHPYDVWMLRINVSNQFRIPVTVGSLPHAGNYI